MTQAYGSRMLSGVITPPGSPQTAVASPIAGQDCSSFTSNMDNTLSAFVAVLPSLAKPVQAGISLLPAPGTSCRSVLLPEDMTTVPAHSPGDDTSCCYVAPLAPSPAAAAPGKKQVHSAGPRWVPAAGQRLSPAPRTAKSTLVAIHPQEMRCSLPWEQMWEFTYPGNNKNSSQLTNKQAALGVKDMTAA